MKRICYVFIVLAIMLCSTVNALEEQQSPVSSRIIENAKSFDTDAEYKYRSNLAWMECYVFQSKDCTVFVDTVTEKPTLVMYFPDGDSSKNEKNYDEIKEIVYNWIKSHNVKIDNCNLFEKTCDKGNNNKEYLFTWRLQNNDGIQLPYIINIVVNSYGDIVDFSEINRPVEISLLSQVKDDDCIAKIKSKVLKEDAILKSNSTIIRLDKDGKQQLVKHFVFRISDEGELVDVVVDALNGDIISIIQIQ